MRDERRMLGLAVSVWLAATTLAQAQVLGALKGTVREKGGRQPLADVKVTVVAEQTATILAELKTDAKGAFYKSGLQPGVYQVRFDCHGYLPAALAMRIGIGETGDLIVELEPVKAMAGGSASLVDTGLDQIRKGRYGDAVETFTRALAGDAGNAILLYYRGLAFDRNREWDKALADYRLAAAAKSGFILPLTAMGNIHARKQEFAQAIEHFRQAAQVGTPDSTSLYNYGVCLVNSGASREAGAVFSQLLALDPGHADGLYQLGLVTLGLGDTARAKELLNRFLQLAPENANAAVARQILQSLN